MEVFSLMKSLPLLVMFGLIAFNAVKGGPLQEKMKKEHVLAWNKLNKAVFVPLTRVDQPSQREYLVSGMVHSYGNHDPFLLFPHQSSAATKKGKKQKDIDTRDQKSVIWFPWQDCYEKHFAGKEPPLGLRGFSPSTTYICQGLKPTESYYATYFDEELGIPVYSAYTLRGDNIKFAKKSLSRPAWRQTTGIKLQGNDKLYPSLPFHRGHLAPAHTLSSDKKAFKSTFTYKNAVPQHTALNSGMWSQFERRIRNYAEKGCVGENGQEGGILNILTGTLFVKWKEHDNGEPQDPHKIPWLAITDKYRYIPPAIAIPSSMWTAGCCVAKGDAKGNFALFANNEETADEAQARQVDIDKLITIIKKDVKSDKVGNVHLFPAFPGCEDKDKKVNLDDYKSKKREKMKKEKH